MWQCIYILVAPSMTSEAYKVYSNTTRWRHTQVKEVVLTNGNQLIVSNYYTFWYLQANSIPKFTHCLHILQRINVYLYKMIHKSKLTSECYEVDIPTCNQHTCMHIPSSLCNPILYKLLQFLVIFITMKDSLPPSQLTSLFSVEINMWFRPPKKSLYL